MLSTFSSVRELLKSVALDSYIETFELEGWGSVDALFDINETDLTSFISDVQMKSGTRQPPAQGPQHDRAERCERPGGRISERDGDCDDGSGPVSRMSRTLTVWLHFNTHVTSL